MRRHAMIAICGIGQHLPLTPFIDIVQAKFRLPNAGTTRDLRLIFMALGKFFAPTMPYIVPKRVTLCTAALW